MTESILLTVKKMLGIAEEYHAFDIDIIMDINSVFLTLNQIGVGPSGFQIVGDTETWSDFVDPTTMPGLQTYVYMKTRLLFDPPTSSFLLDNMVKQCNEFEWRHGVQSEFFNEEEEDEVVTPPPVEDTPIALAMRKKGVVRRV